MSNLLHIEASAAANFDRRPFFIRHRLSGHPLFALERLLALARRLPGDNVEFHAADMPVYTPWGERTPSTDLPLEETIGCIEACGAWVVLRSVELDPEYRALMDRCLDEVGGFYGSVLKGASNRAAFVFISSAKALTPCHIDPENNFLMQIRGTRTIHIGDRSLLGERDLERSFTGGHRNVDMPDLSSCAMKYHLTPGDGVHVPVTSPHWVMNGDGVSVSFSITFLTPKSRRKAIVHKVNAHLRKTGVRPTPPGASRLRDGVKVLGFEAVRSARRLLRSMTPGAASTATGADL